ncbi:MAG TPA: hypothetical protein VKP30_22575 [Polyangiaceae bacterium]|nr:hypothetical protein [Polyangiaceae bacterium]
MNKSELELELPYARQRARVQKLKAEVDQVLAPAEVAAVRSCLDLCQGAKQGNSSVATLERFKSTRQALRP